MISDPTRIQAAIPDPSRSQVTANMTGTIVFDPAGSGNVNNSGWFAIIVNPAADSTYYYGSESTKTMLLPGGVTSTVFCLNNAKVTITFTSAPNYVQGM